MKKTPILLVDDDETLLKTYKKIFEMKGYLVYTESDSTKVKELITNNEIAVIITDVVMPNIDGKELLLIVKSIKPDIEVIMLTAEGRIEDAVETVKRGAFSYLVKPIDIDDMLAKISKAYELFIIKRENNNLKWHLDDQVDRSSLIGRSPKMLEIIRTVNQIANTSSTILIQGESGTGKEVLAKYIHNNSNRKSSPMISVNCAALNDNLFESELFGYEKGAFTGADKMHKGRFEIADNSTIFLDEIAELSKNNQVKLLRVLQEKSFERVGGNVNIKTDFRLIVATNKNLKEEVENGTFREDLYYRVNVLPIYLPPLRSRKEDIPLLISTYINEYALEMKKKIEPCPDYILELFKNYDWPGNVRELKNIVERIVTLNTECLINISDIPVEITHIENEIINTIHCNELDGCKFDLKTARNNFEKNYIKALLSKNSGNVAQTANQLGIARKNLYQKMNKLGIKQ